VNIDQIASILWRRRLAFLVTLLACVGAVVAVTLTLPKTYKATSTLLVSAEGNIVTTDLLNQLTRTYSTLAANPNVAQQVTQRLIRPMTASELLSHMSFAPVENTELIQISAEASTPAQARTLANIYARVFVGRARTQLSSGKTKQATVVLSEPATTPTSPVKPNPPLYIGLGTLLSLLIALGVALLMERLDTRIRVALEDERVFGLPIMARIPRFTLHGGAIPHEVADRFALLKLNLDFVDEDRKQLVVVTSPGVSEGKSTIAANLAEVCAGNGERVVLVEADLRRPGIEKNPPLAEHVTRHTVGLSNYLAGIATEEEVITSTGREGLSIVWSGPIPPNPTRLLQSDRLDLLVGSLRDRYDRIVIDTPPISVGADASAVISGADSVIYVIDQATTKRDTARAGLNQLANVRASLAGVVLNRAPTGQGEYMYYSSRPPEGVTGRSKPDGSRRKARV